MKWTKCLILCIISLCFAKSPKKIIGGARVGVQQYYYTVSLQYLDRHFCGASILNSYTVVTAANCITLDKNVFVGNLKVKIGSDDLLDTSNSTTIEVRYVIPHDEYSPGYFFYGYDIALLRLERPIVFTTNVCSIKMRNSNLKREIKMEIAGWGESSNNSEYTPSRYLHAINLFNKNRDACMQIYKTFNQRIFNFHNRMIGCALSEFEHQDVTLGDGGNGLIFVDRIAGVVSLQKKEKNSIVFTKIYSHRQWIKNMILKNI